MPALGDDAKRDRLPVKDAARDKLKPEIGLADQKLVDRAGLLQASRAGGMTAPLELRTFSPTMFTSS